MINADCLSSGMFCLEIKPAKYDPMFHVHTQRLLTSSVDFDAQPVPIFDARGVCSILVVTGVVCAAAAAALAQPVPIPDAMGVSSILVVTSEVALDAHPVPIAGAVVVSSIFVVTGLV